MLEKGFETQPAIAVLEASPEQAERSFDVTASVKILRHDLYEFGEIRPETRDQVYDEELSFVAEGVDRHSYTKFDLAHQEGLGLVIFQKGEWRPYKGMLMTGQEVATKEADEDSRKTFAKRWADRDLEIGYQMEALNYGESINWASQFPYQEQKLYGDKFLKNNCGLQPERKMGFLYRAQRNADGSVTLESHSVDNSDPDAFAAVESALKDDPEIDIATQVAIYDQTLSKKNGLDYHAGRTRAEKEANAYEFITKQKGYVEYYFNKIEELAKSSFNGEELEDKKKRLTYGFWARVKELLNERIVTSNIETSSVKAQPSSAQIAAEINNALVTASKRGEVMPGCGGSVQLDDPFDQSPDKMLNSIFGERLSSATDKYGSRTFECPKGHTNIRPKDQLIERCQKCNTSVRC